MNTLIVILGATASGKTDFAIEMALHHNCEIISADSRQFYRGMSIGTAAPTQEQLSIVPHHFVGFLELEQYYSAGLFEREALALADTLFAKKSTVVVVGGSMMYIDALCNGIDDLPVAPENIRNKYSEIYATEGIETLQNLLKTADPIHYNRVDLNNPRRIMRALEVCEITGKPYSSLLSGKKYNRNFEIVKIGISRPRSELYERINKRVDLMLQAGLEDEARQLHSKRGLNSLETVGYKELFDHFEGKTSYSEAVELIKRNTRRYAKRQMTWWRGDPTIKWAEIG